METREIHVLVVEDSPEERRLIGLELSEIEDPIFRTRQAGRLSEAITELAKGRTDVVLLDLSLPDSGGLKGLIRLCQEFPSLPVVVYTGMDDQEMALQALREGAQDFLVKGQTEPGVLKRVLLHAIERKRVDVALNDSRESLREAQRLETLGRLAGKIAHDFNNILTTIVGFSDLLLEDLQGHPAADDILEIKRAGERGAALTSSILSFSRRQRPTLEALSLNEVVEGVRGMLKQLLPRSIALELSLEPELPLALADLGQVEQALVNLVANARDAMPGGGTVRVLTGLRQVVREHPPASPLPRPGHYAVIKVEDNGAGMDPATLDRIFEPFFTTKPRGAGTGLGLATVISIVKACGGGVEVASTPGKGTTFILSFPLAESQAQRRVPALPLPHVAAAGLAVFPSSDSSEPPPAFRVEAQGDFLLSQAEMSEQLRHLYHLVSHDLQEPLRMVSSYLSLVKRRGSGNLSDELLEFIDYAVDGSQRMQGMLDGLLRYSRGLKAPPRFESTPLYEVYEKVVHVMPGAEDVCWQGERPTLQAGFDHLAVILRELLSNALKFARPEDPRVVVECLPDEGDWQVRVTDNGQGLPEGSVEQCFRLFGRLHGRDEAAGLGVGLTLAQCLAEKYGAEILLENAPHGGGRSVLRWPARAHKNGTKEPAGS